MKDAIEQLRPDFVRPPYAEEPVEKHCRQLLQDVVKLLVLAEKQEERGRS